MNGDNKMETEMVEIFLKNPQNLLSVALRDPVFSLFQLHNVLGENCTLPLPSAR